LGQAKRDYFSKPPGTFRACHPNLTKQTVCRML
jgi:hypothetical protein